MHLRTVRKTDILSMFNRIAATYDFLNHFLSLGFDFYWRKRAVFEFHKAGIKPGARLLDIACGTGDLSFEALSLNPAEITGVDLSDKMLEKAEEKARRKKLFSKIVFRLGDAENLVFPDNNFDGTLVAYGVRNFENLTVGLKEILRVLKPGGNCMILEFSKPQENLTGKIFAFYFRYFLPYLGAIISRDKYAYAYLKDSVEKFPSGTDFLHIFEQSGFRETKCVPLSFGICSVYLGKK